MTTNSCPKRSRASSEQLSHLVDFMVENPGLAAGKFQKMHGKVEFEKKWTQLIEMLNSLGGTVKTVEQWQTVWRDLKSRTSIKVRERKKQQALTGNKHIHQEPLTELERKILGIIGSHYIEGHECVAENVPLDEELQLRLEDGDEIAFEIPPPYGTAVNLVRETPSTPVRTPRTSKRKREDSENESQKFFLEIAVKQADALKLLADCNAAAVQNSQTMAEALKGIGEGLKANADAMNNLATATKVFFAAISTAKLL